MCSQVLGDPYKYQLYTKIVGHTKCKTAFKLDYSDFVGRRNHKSLLLFRIILQVCVANQNLYLLCLLIRGANNILGEKNYHSHAVILSIDTIPCVLKCVQRLKRQVTKWALVTPAYTIRVMVTVLINIPAMRTCWSGYCPQNSILWPRDCSWAILLLFLMSPQPFQHCSFYTILLGANLMKKEKRALASIIYLLAIKK